MPIRALLFDLFGTVVHFKPAVPTVQIAGTERRTTMPWLQEAAAHELPAVDFNQVLVALMEETEAMARNRAPEFFEVPSRQRFERALVRAGLQVPDLADIAARLSLTHMDHLASMTIIPDDHSAVLEALATRFPLALISNFDHGPTARRILAAHGVERFFCPILISDEFGRRKPHPSIFATALQQLGIAANDALFVGDSVGDDIVGAHNAGIPVAWMNRRADPLPEGVPPPRFVIERLGDLLRLL